MVHSGSGLGGCGEEEDSYQPIVPQSLLGTSLLGKITHYEIFEEEDLQEAFPQAQWTQAMSAETKAKVYMKTSRSKS